MTLKPLRANTQTIQRQQPTNYPSVFDHFVEFTLKRLSEVAFLQEKILF